MKYISLIFFLCSSGLATAQTLDDYFKLAAENNPGLQAEYRDFEASMQKVPQVSSLSDPTLTVSAFGQMIETRVGPSTGPILTFADVSLVWNP